MSNTERAVPFTITLHVRDHCLCLATQRAARALARRFDEAFRPVGLTNGQFSLLMGLNRPEPPSIGALASLLAMDRTTLTANLKPLARDGLVHLETAPTDRRGRLVRLTEAGLEKLAAAMPIWTRTHAELDEFPAALDASDMAKQLGALTQLAQTRNKSAREDDPD